MHEFLVYGSYRLLGALTGPLPPRIGYSLARGAGRLLYKLDPPLRRTLTHNFCHVLGPDADPDRVQALVRQACVHMCKGHFDLFRVSRLSKEEIKDLVCVHGLDRLQSLYATGRGVVAVSAHLGNVDIVSQIPLVYGMSICGAAQRVRPERLFRYTRRIRQSHGLRLLPADEPLTGLYRALKRGEIVGLPADRDITGEGAVCEFFGTPTRLPSGPVRVALRTGAALLPVFAMRLPNDSFVVQVEPELEIPRTGNRDSDVAAGMVQVVEVMERFISRHPEQWLVAAPVWPME